METIDENIPRQEALDFTFCPDFSLLEACFRVDYHVFLQLGLLDYLRYGMPPERQTDTEYNENYQADRRHVTLYANRLERIRTTLQQLFRETECDGELAGKLDFNPLCNVAGRSPLDHYRNLLLETYNTWFRMLKSSHRPTLCHLIYVKGELLNDFLEAAKRLTRRPINLQTAIEKAWKQKAALLREPYSSSERRELERLFSSLTALSSRDLRLDPSAVKLRLLVLERALNFPDEAPEMPGLLQRLFAYSDRQVLHRPRSILLELYCLLLAENLM